MSDDAMKQALAARLRSVLAARNWTVERLSKECVIPKRSLDNYVQGRQIPGAQAIASICSGAAVDANWLLLGSDASEYGSPASLVHDASFTAISDLLSRIRRRLDHPVAAEQLKEHLDVEGHREASKWALRVVDEYRRMDAMRGKAAASDAQKIRLSE